MIKETFGLTTANFAKFIVLIVFLFFFIRTVNLMISLVVNKKSKGDLRKLFIATEILVWGTLIVWIFLMVPISKLKFFGVFVILNSLNFWLWIRIKEGVAGLFFRISYSPRIDDYIKIDNQNLKIKQLNFDYFVATTEKSEKRYKYIEALQKGIETPIIDLIKIELSKENKFKNEEELYSVLKKNGFIKDETKLKISLNETFLEIKILSYLKSDIEEIKQFINEIF